MMKTLAVAVLLALAANSAHAQAGIRVGGPATSPSFGSIRPNMPSMTSRGFDNSRLNMGKDNSSGIADLKPKIKWKATCPESGEVTILCNAGPLVQRVPRENYGGAGDSKPKTKLKKAP